ncbi:MAG: hypothetical protein RLZZ127_1125, partial [Planctomycetota bacterium]
MPRLRRTVQMAALTGFLVLVAMTPAAGRDFAVPAWAALPFQFDPLVAVIAIAAGTVGLGAVLAGLAGVVLALVCGRAFCGWLCPLGTACDGVRRIAAPVTGRVQARLARRSGGWTDRLAHGPLMVLIIGSIALVLGLPLLGALVP